MGPGLAAMLIFIVLIILWSVFTKRNIVEIAFIGMVVVALFGRKKAPELLVGGMKYALNYEVLFASLAFVFMSFLLQYSNVLSGMLEIFTRLFGRLKGGPAYVNTAISAVLGMLSGGNSPNAATSGAFTADWLLKSGWTKEQAATLIAANGGLGSGFPPSSSLFIVLAFPTVAAAVGQGELYIALFVTGFYQVLWRLIYIYYIVRKNKITPTLHGEVAPISTVIREYGINMLLLLGAVIPVMLNMGPVSEFFSSRSDVWAAAIDSVNILVWIPILMITIILLLDGKNLIKKFKSAEDFIEKLIPHVASIGGLLFFIFAASNIISKLGLGNDVAALLDYVNFSPVLTVIILLVLVAFVAGPLSSTATLTSVGSISHAIMVGVGMNPLAAAAALLVVASTEGASPPASGALFIACGLTKCDPPKIYLPLITWFVIPIVAIACLVCFGIMPLP